MSTGNQGVALMQLAEQTTDVAMAASAVEQIETAFTVTRDAGHAPNAACLEEQLPKARAILTQLQRRTK